MRMLLRIFSSIFGLLTFLAFILALVDTSWAFVIICGVLWLTFGFLATVAPASRTAQLAMAVSSEEFGGSAPHVVQSLLMRGANVNALGLNGRPLHIAALWGRLEMAELLLRHGADPNGRDSEGWTPLHVAANNDRGDFVDLLIAKGSHIDSRTRDGDTPLHIGTGRYGLQAVERLLAHGANPNAPGAEGTTALQEVARSARAFAKPMTLNENMIDPSDDALDQCQELADLLRSHGAR